MKETYKTVVKTYWATAFTFYDLMEDMNNKKHETFKRITKVYEYKWKRDGSKYNGLFVIEGIKK